MEKIELKKYDQYKDSCVEWLGEIPEHWKIVRSKRLFYQRKQRSRSEDIQLTASQKYGIIPQKKFMELEGRKVTQVEFNNEILKHVEIDDFVISMRSFQGGIEYSNYSGCVSSAYIALVPIKHVVSDFFKYLLKSDSYIKALSSTSNLVRDGQALRFDNFNQIDLIIVPDGEQTAIANFLNEKCDKIDTAIAKMQKLITLLKERKQILIQNAVTGKVVWDGNAWTEPAEVKDSGVAWIGEIPEHWDLKNLRYAFKFLNSKRIPLSAVEREDMKGQYPYYGASGIIDYVDDYIFDEKLILIAEDGANLLSKSTPLAFAANGKYWVNNHAHILKPLYIGFRYWAELLSLIDYTSYISGAAQPKLSRENLGNVKVIVPPSNEIKSITTYIESQSAIIDKAIALQKKQIEKLKEYKASLINSAVTGKIKVC